MATQPRNYQGSSYKKQSEEFQRQHGNMGTPEGFGRLGATAAQIGLTAPAPEPGSRAPRKLVIINESGYPMEVHCVGCRDLSNRRRFPRGVQQDWVVAGFAGLREEHKELNSQFDQPYKFEELFRVMPCCGKE